MATFTQNAAEDDNHTPSGVHDILRRTHGLLPRESEHRSVSAVEREAKELPDLHEEMSMDECCSLAKQMTAKLDEARARISASETVLDQWRAGKPEILQKSLNVMAKFLTSNPAIVPEVLEVLKPMEARCRSDINQAFRTTSDVLARLDEMRQRHDAFDRALEDRDQVRTDGGLLEQTQTQLRLVREELDQKTRDYDVLRKSAKEASERVKTVEDELRQFKSRHQVQKDIMRKEIAEKDQTLGKQRELLSKLPSLNEYVLLCDKARNQKSDTDEVLKFCSSVLGAISASGGDLGATTVSIECLRKSWNVALGWSQRNGSTLTRQHSYAAVDGLVQLAATSKDALGLAQLLLLRAHASPSLLSVALIEQLAVSLNTADEVTVTRSMGFVYALMQDKEREFGGTWSFSRSLLIVRCLSVLASHVQEADICSKLVRFAENIHSKISPSSPSSPLVLVQALLEHALKLFKGLPELLAETLAQSKSVPQIKTRTGERLYPDGENLVVVNTDSKVAFVRPHQFRWEFDEMCQPGFIFEAAPLLGTRRVTLPSIVEEEDLYDIFHESLTRAMQPESVGISHPDYTFIVQ